MIETIQMRLNAIGDWFKSTFYFSSKDCYISNKMLSSTLSRRYKQCYIEVSDNKKYLVNGHEMKKFLQINLGRFRKYTRDNFDCEDYARVLDGLFAQFNPKHACGRIHVTTKSGKHALNCFIDEFNKLYCIEPQTNEIFRLEDKSYKPYMILV